MPPTKDREDVAAFTDALDEFARSERRVRGRFSAARPAGELSMSQYHLLEPLAAAGESLCVGEVAESAGVSAPSATRMLDGLEARGLVQRERDARDRRIVHVGLSDEGRALVEAKRERIVRARTAIFDALPASERRAAARLLRSLAAAIEELHP